MEKEHKTQHVPICYELCHTLMSFIPFLPKSSPHTIHRVYFRNPHHFFQKELVTTKYSSFPKVQHIVGTEKGRTWLAGLTSQDHPDYTHSIWSSSINMHFIHSQKQNYLNNKAIAFSRNSHLLVSNPLFPMQRHLDLF